MVRNVIEKQTHLSGRSVTITMWKFWKKPELFLSRLSTVCGHTTAVETRL